MNELPARTPVALLPVHLQTRYGTSASGASELRVRVVPDDIHRDAHIPDLTPAEWSAGQEFLRAGSDKTAWARLADAHGATRAAWIAEQSRPGTPQPPPADTWSRLARARLLPDRWHAYWMQGGELHGPLTSNPVTGDPALSPDPSAPEPDDGAWVDEGMRWMVDFERAEATGLGFRIPLPDPARLDIERLIVLGVVERHNPADAADALGSLLEAHHYTDGLELLPRGTPTNNSQSSSSGFGVPDPGHERSYAIEREQLPFAAGARLGAMLGVGSRVFAHTAGAGHTDEDDALYMNRALWPVSWGYFAERMLGVPRKYRERFDGPRSHFERFVRSGGPLSSISVGDQPYGVLPVTRTEKLAPRPGDGTDRVLELALHLRDWWRAGLEGLAPSSGGETGEPVPRVRPGGDPEALLRVLGMDAYSTSFRARAVLGPDYVANLARLLDEQWTSGGGVLDAAWWKEQSELARSALATLSERLTPPSRLPANPPLSAATFASDAFAYPLRGPLVEVEGRTDPPAYVAWLAQPRTAAELMREEGFGYARGKVPLLALLLRHATLLELTDVVGVDGREPELIDIRMKLPKTPERTETPLRMVPADVTVSPEFQEALAHLAGVPPQRLERLLGETMDLCAHRLDAWLTSFATRRLDELRTDPESSGTVVGAYGFVEHLALRVERPGGGFVHTPSRNQAVAAAVLRSGYLAHRDGDAANPFTVDLSSARVRQAQRLVNGVRQGVPLAALLGYGFERTLHERDADAFIAHFRTLAPADSVSGSVVVDGLRLCELWRADAIKLGTPPLPAATSPGGIAITAALQELDNAVDALADATLAEGVFQAVSRNASRAGATLAAVTRGEAPPPELSFSDTPRSGADVKHRILALLPAEATATTKWRTGAKSIRARVEPRLEAWAGQLLGGDPRRIRAEVAHVDPATGKVRSRTTVTLHALGLCALDLVYAAGDLRAELAARIALELGTDDIRISYVRKSRWPASAISLEEAIEASRAIRALLASARELTDADLAPAGAQVESSGDADELRTRVELAVSRLSTLGDELDGTSDGGRLRSLVLEAATFGVPDAVPTADPQRLTEQVAAVRRELAARVKTIAAIAPSLGLIERELTRAQAALGRDFRVLPTIAPPNRRALAATFTASTSLQGKDPTAAVAWFQRVARVRPGARRLDTVMLYADALRRTGRHAVPSAERPYAFLVGQLPVKRGDRWAGLHGPIPAGRLSLVAHRAGTVDFSKRCVGLFVDEWTETVPAATATTEVAFHYDGPDATAPNAILLAVPPNDDAAWDLNALLETVIEAMEMAKLRTVDGDALRGLGHYLPACYLALNLAGDTVSTDLTYATSPPS